MEVIEGIKSELMIQTINSEELSENSIIILFNYILV